MELINSASMERLTGTAYFTPVGGVGINLGNIDMLRLDYGLKSIDIMRSRRGIVYPRKRHFHARSPIYTIQGDQFHSARIPMQLAGTRLANTTRDSTTGAVYTFTAVPGAAYNIGQHGIWVNSVMRESDTLVADYDYFLDAFNGWIELPEKGGSVAPGDVVDVTYTFPSQDLETYTALDTLSRDGQLIVYAEDHLGPPAREKWVMNVTISIKGMPDTEPSKFRTWSMEALIKGMPTVYKRPQQKGYDYLVTEDGDIIDFS